MLVDPLEFPHCFDELNFRKIAALEEPLESAELADLPVPCSALKLIITNNFTTAYDKYVYLSFLSCAYPALIVH